MALDDARAAGDSPAGQLVTLEDLCRLGRPAPSEEAAKTRAVDALSGPEKRAFTRRVSLITHCDRLFIEAAKGAKKRDIFKQAALAEFDDAEKPANVDPAKEQPFTWRTVGVLWRKYVEAGWDFEALKPRFCDRGQRRWREADPLTALIRNTLRKQWLTGKLSIGAVRTHVGQAIAQSVDGRLLGKPAPSERTIYREIMRDEVFRLHMLQDPRQAIEEARPLARAGRAAAR